MLMPQTKNTRPSKHPIDSLLAELALVESKLLTLKNVTVNTAALARAGRNNGEQTTGLELLLESGLNLAVGGLALGVLLLNSLGLLLRLNDLTGLLLATAAEVGAVVGLVPLAERNGVDLDDGGTGQGVGADQLVVGRVESDSDDADLAGNTLRSPREVAGVEAEGAELAVTTTGADEMDALGSNTGVGWLAAGFESALLPCNKKIIRDIFDRLERIADTQSRVPGGYGLLLRTVMGTLGS